MHHDPNNLTEEQKAEMWHEDPFKWDPTFFHAFWGAFKGSTKGLLGGLIIGLLVGGIFGLGLGVFAFPFLELHLASVGLANIGFGSFVAASSLVCSVVGAGLGIHKFEPAGVAAGSVASALKAEEDRNNRAMQYMLEQATGKHIEIPSDAVLDGVASRNGEIPAHLTDSPHLNSASSPSSKLFHWKVGIPGALIGVGFGVLLAGAALSPAGFVLLESIGIGAIAHGAAASAVPAVAAAAFGLFGLSFGIERNHMRKVFDVTDKIFAGSWFENWGDKGKSILPSLPSLPVREPQMSLTPGQMTHAMGQSLQPLQTIAEPANARSPVPAAKEKQWQAFLAKQAAEQFQAMQQPPQGQRYN